MNSSDILISCAAGFLAATYVLFSKVLRNQRPHRGARSRRAASNDPSPKIPSIDRTPDTPQSFGYKMEWLAIPTEDSEKVIGALGLVDRRPANWAAGINVAYSCSSWFFVAPPLDGWTLAPGQGFPDVGSPERNREFLDFIEKLAKVFPDFCYFGTHRVVEYHAWVKVAGGKIERAFAYLGERGETLFDSGSMTEEELELGFAFFDERSPEAASEGYYDREYLRFPNENDVMEISAAWSIDTQSLDERNDKGTGHLGRIGRDQKTS